MRGLARAGQGEAEFIAPGERIEGKVMRQVSRALSPSLDDVAIEWGGLEVAQSPREVPPVFADGRVLVFGRLEQARASSVTLRAVGKDGPIAFTLPIDPERIAEGTLVGTLWARRTIRDLEEGGAPRGSQQPRAAEAKDERVKAEIVRLGTAWSLVSRHTSFVAVETRETPTEGAAQLRKVPVAITRGWHGLWRPLVAPAAAMPSGLIMDSMDFALDEAEPPPSRSAPAPRGGGAFMRLTKMAGFGARHSEKRARTSLRPLDRLVALQKADGSWALGDALADTLGWEDANALRQASGRTLAGDDERALATALAVAWLERECTAERDEWRLLADKAREWLDRTREGSSGWLRVAGDILARRS